MESLPVGDRCQHPAGLDLGVYPGDDPFGRVFIEQTTSTKTLVCTVLSSSTLTVFGEDVAHDTGEPGPRRTAVGLIVVRGPNHSEEDLSRQVGDVTVIGHPAREVEPD